MTVTLDRHIVDVVVEPDAMRAWIRPAEGVEPNQIDEAKILSALRHAEVVVNDEVMLQVRQFLNHLPSDPLPVESFMVAEARLPGTGRPAVFEPSDAWTAQAKTPFERILREMHHVVTADELVGHVHPPISPSEGVDVCGRQIPAPSTRYEPIRLDKGLVLDADGKTVRASRAGLVVRVGNRLTLRECREIPGNSRQSGDRVDSELDLVIRGNVSETGEVASRRSVYVLGTVEPSCLNSAEDVIVYHGIIGRGRGRVTAGRDVMAKYCEDVLIHSGRDVRIGHSAINTNLTAIGRLMAPDAAIIGGQIRVGLGVDVHTLGSESGVPTSVVVGGSLRPDQPPDHFEAELRNRWERIHQLRQVLVSLRNQSDTLTDAQKARSEQLSTMLVHLETEWREMHARIAVAVAPALEAGSIRAAVCIHEGVTVILGGRTYRFDRPMNGPIRIEIEKVRSAREMIAVQEATGGVTILKAKKVNPT